MSEGRASPDASDQSVGELPQSGSLHPCGGGDKRIEWWEKKVVGRTPSLYSGLLGAPCRGHRSSSLVFSSALGAKLTVRVRVPPWWFCVGARRLVVGTSDFPAKNPRLHRGRSASRTTRPGTPQNSVPPAELSSSAGGPNKDPVGSISFWMCVCVCGPSL